MQAWHVVELCEQIIYNDEVCSLATAACSCAAYKNMKNILVINNVPFIVALKSAWRFKVGKKSHIQEWMHLGTWSTETGGHG